MRGYITVCNSNCENGDCEQNRKFVLDREYVRIEDLSMGCPDYKGIDKCQECHNALVCLAWAKDGIRAKCAYADYFAKHYVHGKEKIIGAELLDELEGN